MARFSRIPVWGVGFSANESAHVRFLVVLVGDQQELSFFEESTGKMYTNLAILDFGLVMFLSAIENHTGIVKGKVL